MVLKYKGKKFILKYLEGKVDYAVFKRLGVRIIFIDNKLSKRMKSKMLHKALR